MALISNLINFIIIIFLENKGGDFASQTPYLVAIVFVWITAILLPLFFPKQNEETSNKLLNAVLYIFCSPIPFVTSCSFLASI